MEDTLLTLEKMVFSTESVCEEKEGRSGRARELRAGLKSRAPWRQSSFIFLENSQQREGSMGPALVVAVVSPLSHKDVLSYFPSCPQCGDTRGTCSVCWNTWGTWTLQGCLLWLETIVMFCSFTPYQYKVTNSYEHAHADSCVCSSMCTRTCHGMKVRGQLPRASSLLPPWWSQAFRLGSKHQHRPPLSASSLSSPGTVISVIWNF